MLDSAAPSSVAANCTRFVGGDFGVDALDNCRSLRCERRCLREHTFLHERRTRVTTRRGGVPTIIAPCTSSSSASSSESCPSLVRCRAVRRTAPSRSSCRRQCRWLSLVVVGIIDVVVVVAIGGVVFTVFLSPVAAGRPSRARPMELQCSYVSVAMSSCVACEISSVEASLTKVVCVKRRYGTTS
jgi:hypothetical protein